LVEMGKERSITVGDTSRAVYRDMVKVREEIDSIIETLEIMSNEELMKDFEEGRKFMNERLKTTLWNNSKASHLYALLKYEGLKVQFTTLTGKINATSHMREYGLDFADALAYQCMIENDITKIISYDKHFDRLGDIKRIAPRS